MDCPVENDGVVSRRPGTRRQLSRMLPRKMLIRRVKQRNQAPKRRKSRSESRCATGARVRFAETLRLVVVVLSLDTDTQMETKQDHSNSFVA